MQGGGLQTGVQGLQGGRGAGGVRGGGGGGLPVHSTATDCRGLNPRFEAEISCKLLTCQQAHLQRSIVDEFYK